MGLRDVLLACIDQPLNECDGMDLAISDACLQLFITSLSLSHPQTSENRGPVTLRRCPSTAKRTSLTACAVDTDTPTDTPRLPSDNAGTVTGLHATSIGLSEGSSVRKSGPQACVQFLCTEHGYVSSMRAG